MGNCDIALGKLYIDNGPVQMYISAERYGQPLSKAVRKTEKKVNDLLIALTKVLPYAQRPWPELSNSGNFPKVLENMIKAVAATQDEKMTPMAAVAGAFADIIADFLVEHGATKVIVNNGGDIAVRLKSGESIRVGISPQVGAKPTHFINVTADSKIGGIATSGLGGRSFTLGVANAVVILAKQATTADACATHIANSTNIDSPAVTRCLAHTIDPYTDIPNLLVTTKLEKLQRYEVLTALDNGLSRVKQLKKEGLIYGAIIFVQDQMRVWPEDISLHAM